MLDPRIYRAALVPVLFALSSRRSRSRPARGLRAALAPDAFSGERATAPSCACWRAALPVPRARRRRRRPRWPGACVEQLGRAGLQVAVTRADGARSTAGASCARSSPSGPGRSSRRIVVVAHRDAPARPGKAELSGTAALLELARVFERPHPAQDAGARLDERRQRRRRRRGASWPGRLLRGGRRCSCSATSPGAQRAPAARRALVQRRRGARRSPARDGAGRGAAGDRPAPGRAARAAPVRAPGLPADARRAGRAAGARACRRCCCRSAASAPPGTRGRRLAQRFRPSAAPRCAPSPRSTAGRTADRGAPAPSCCVARKVLPGLGGAAARRRAAAARRCWRRSTGSPACAGAREPVGTWLGGCCASALPFVLALRSRGC